MQSIWPAEGARLARQWQSMAINGNQWQSMPCNDERDGSIACVLAHRGVFARIELELSIRHPRNLTLP